MAQNGLFPPSLLLLRLSVLHYRDTCSSSANRLFLPQTSHSSIAKPDLASTSCGGLLAQPNRLLPCCARALATQKLGISQEPEGPRRPKEPLEDVRFESPPVTTSHLSPPYSPTGGLVKPPTRNPQPAPPPTPTPKSPGIGPVLLSTPSVVRSPFHRSPPPRGFRPCEPGWLWNPPNSPPPCGATAPMGGHQSARGALWTVARVA